MSDPKVRGVVELIEETKSYGQSGFQKRLVVLEQEDGRFSNYIPLEFIQANCELADGLNVGDDVEVTYRLTGRKWQRDAKSETKYFLNAEALSFSVVKAAGGSGASVEQPSDDFVDGLSESSDFDEEDVPF